MKQRKIHRLLGLFMMIPLLCWGLTGVVFLTKPGYEGAYERLSIKTYDIDSELRVMPQAGWQDTRFIRSVLGLHLLVKENGEFKQYHPQTLLPLDPPSQNQVKELIADAIKVNSERYGLVDQVDGATAYTNTGIIIQLDWDEMTLSQRGNDRVLIETLYKIHYLQWTKWEGINLMLGVLGLFCLITLTIIGFSAYLSKSNKKDDS